VLQNPPGECSQVDCPASKGTLNCRLSPVFRIKICGITTLADAQAAVAAGADALGLNFYEPSPRYVAPTLAAEIAQALPGQVTVVGVFVNASADQINSLCDSVGLDAIQLHGDEPPELLREINRNCALIRVRRYGAGGLAKVADDLEACVQRGGRRPDAMLLDADRAGQYGGTGHALPWAELRGHELSLSDTPFVLAGGLTPENVAEAIRTVQPTAVDTASGVEISPGVKDPAKMLSFIAAAQAAFAEARS
jgi:phosphoribosylanthranilate isomerase